MTYPYRIFFCTILSLVWILGEQTGTQFEASELQSISYIEDLLLDLHKKQEALIKKLEAPDAPKHETELRLQAESVIRGYESILTRAPKDLTVNLLYAKFLRQMGKRDDAQLVFERILKLDPNIAVAHQQVANYYAEEDKPDLALIHYLKAIDLEPETAAYHYSLGEYCIWFKDFLLKNEIYDAKNLDQLILDSFKKAAELEPDNIDFQMRYAESFYDISSPQWDKALEIWQSIGDKASSDIVKEASRLHQARIYLKKNNKPEAERILSETDPKYFKENYKILRSECTHSHVDNKETP